MQPHATSCRILAHSITFLLHPFALFAIRMFKALYSIRLHTLNLIRQTCLQHLFRRSAVIFWLSNKLSALDDGFLDT